MRLFASQTQGDQGPPTAPQPPADAPAGPGTQLATSMTRHLSLASQQLGARPPPPPAPLFSPPAADGGGGDDDAVPPCSQRAAPMQTDAAPPCSLPASADVDVTPADALVGLEYDPSAAAGGGRRSPARLSPNRAKRPRRDGSDDAPPGFAPPPPPRAPARSPPAYRSAFRDCEAEAADYAPWAGAGARAGAAAAGSASAPALPRFRAEFKELGSLGQGAFSKVFRARHRLDGREYAVKRSLRPAPRGGAEWARFLQEAQCMAAVPPHPGVVRYYAAWAEPAPPGAAGEPLEHTYLQLERCDESLRAHAELEGRPPEAELLRVAREVGAALAHLHAHGVAHGDVKPDNIFLAYPEGGGGGGAGGAAGRPRFVLGDFGQAARLGGAGPAGVEEGDRAYLSREALNADVRFLDKSDVFALGCTLLRLATGRELPQGGQAYEDLREGRLPLLTAVSASCGALIRRLLRPDPAARPAARELAGMRLLQTPEEQAAAAAAAPAAPAAAPPPAPPRVGAKAPAPAAGAKPAFGGLTLQRHPPK